MKDVVSIALIWDFSETPPEKKIAVLFADGTYKKYMMTSENVASFNAFMSFQFNRALLDHGQKKGISPNMGGFEG